MKTLADFKRALALGTKWHCFHELHNADMGVRELVHKNSSSVGFLTEKGTISHLHYPKASQIEFCDDGRVKIKREGDGRYLLTYKKVTE